MINTLTHMARGNQFLMVAMASIPITWAEHANLCLSTISATIGIVAGCYSIAAHRRALKNAKDDLKKYTQQTIRDAMLNLRADEQNTRTQEQNLRDAGQTSRDMEQTSRDAGQTLRDDVAGKRETQAINIGQ